MVFTLGLLTVHMTHFFCWTFTACCFRGRKLWVNNDNLRCKRINSLCAIDMFGFPGVLAEICWCCIILKTVLSPSQHVLSSCFLKKIILWCGRPTKTSEFKLCEVWGSQFLHNSTDSWSMSSRIITFHFILTTIIPPKPKSTASLPHVPAERDTLWTQHSHERDAAVGVRDARSPHSTTNSKCQAASHQEVLSHPHPRATAGKVSAPTDIGMCDYSRNSSFLCIKC